MKLVTQNYKKSHIVQQIPAPKKISSEKLAILNK